MNKNTAILALIIIIGVFGYFTFFTNDNALDILEQEKLEAINERDKAFKVRDSLNLVNIKITDSLRNEELNIKYTVDEKPIYIDRDIDFALDVLTNYNYTRAETEN